MTTGQVRHEFQARSRPLFFAPHFIFLAKTLADMMPDDAVHSAWDHAVWKKFVFTIAHDLEGNNDRFNRKRFLTDCGLPPPTRR